MADAMSPAARSRVREDGYCRISALETDDSNVWLAPDDHFGSLLGSLRRLRGFLELVVTLGLTGLGVYVLLSEHLLSEWPELGGYVLGSLCADLMGIVVAGGLMLCLRVYFGESAVHHAQPCVSIFLRVLQGGMWYGLIVMGIYFLFKYFSNLTTHYPYTFLYLLLQVAMSSLYTLGTCSVVLGGFGYIWEKVGRKLRRAPIVEFQQPGFPIWYAGHAGLSAYEASLIRMRGAQPPQVAEVPSMTGPLPEIGTLGRDPADQLLERMGIFQAEEV